MEQRGVAGPTMWSPEMRRWSPERRQTTVYDAAVAREREGEGRRDEEARGLTRSTRAGSVVHGEAVRRRCRARTAAAGVRGGGILRVLTPSQHAPLAPWGRGERGVPEGHLRRANVGAGWRRFETAAADNRREVDDAGDEPDDPGSIPHTRRERTSTRSP